MDIESKRWRIMTGRVAGQAELRNKLTGRTHWPAIGDVPDAGRLALMKESDFDSAMAELAL